MSEHEPYQTADEASPASDDQTNQEDSNAQSGEFAEQPAATRDDKGDEGEGTGSRAGEYS